MIGLIFSHTTHLSSYAYIIVRIPSFCLYRGSTIGLAVCGIWLIFVAIFGMGAENRSGKREFQLRAGAEFCVIKGSGCENRKGKVAGYGTV